MKRFRERLPELFSWRCIISLWWRSKSAALTCSPWILSFHISVGLKCSKMGKNIWYMIKHIHANSLGHTLPISVEVMYIIILRHIYNMEAKSSSLSNRCVYLTRCLRIAFTLNDAGQNVHVSEFEFFCQIEVNLP